VVRQIAAVENQEQINCPYCNRKFSTCDIVVDHSIRVHPGNPITVDLLANGHDLNTPKKNQQETHFLTGYSLPSKVPEKNTKHNVFLRLAKEATKTVDYRHYYKAFPFYSFLLVWGVFRTLHDIAVRAVCADAYGVLPYLKQLAEAYCRSVQGGVVVLKRIEGDALLHN